MSTAYENLAAKLDFAGSQKLITILEFMLTPEQAAICDALPGSPAEVAEKLGMDAAKVSADLDDMFSRGVVYIRGDMSKRSSFRFARWIMQLHDGVQADQRIDPEKDKKFFELWHDFCLAEMYPYYAKMAADDTLPKGRVIPAYHAIKDLPDMQPWENFREILKAQETIAVVPCSCRWRTISIGEPCQYTDEHEFKCFQFGKGAEYAILRGSGKRLTLEEAIALADKAEEDALVRVWSFDQRMHIYTCCQCCQDCCCIFVPLNDAGIAIEQGYAKSRYVAEIDQDKCSGCQNCVERCNLNAIDMVKQGKKYKATVEQDKCYGCGVCVLKCEPGALKLKCVRPVDYVPEQVQAQHG
ncbi:MAG: ATP-binding protein [Bacillota bacterium]